ncbi:MAG TPA: hypothetical protein VI299_06540 [Polyangiales bacterium]
MTRFGWIVLLCGVWSATAQADDKRPAKDKPAPQEPGAQDPNQCAKAEATTRWVGMGYTHIVTLHNGCAQTVRCTVWTSVDPEPKQSVTAAAGEDVEVVTRRGSPARELSAFKQCSFR